MTLLRRTLPAAIWSISGLRSRKMTLISFIRIVGLIWQTTFRLSILMILTTRTRCRKNIYAITFRRWKTRFSEKALMTGIPLLIKTGSDTTSIWIWSRQPFSGWSRKYPITRISIQPEAIIFIRRKISSTIPAIYQKPAGSSGDRSGIWIRAGAFLECRIWILRDFI